MSPNPDHRAGLRKFAHVIGALLLCLPLAVLAAGEHIEITRAELDPFEDGFAVNAQFNLGLSPDLEQALERGMSLYFVVEFELTRPRWYWFDEKSASTSMTYRLSYHALTRQYRLSTGNLQLGFPTLGEAIGVLTSLRDWRVVDRSAVHPGEQYTASVRMRLDTSQLPKPFQLNAITNREWDLQSDWRRFGFEVAK